ncbi:MAG TPA: hypothetical protein VJ860_20210 [Polyangia bacterium]|jgi:hypothetical protein|nr:hypothetical protein [Polyangia bacterium]
MKLVTDLFLITYPKDYDWIPYLFRSIARNVSGYDRLIVVVEEGEPSPLDILRAHGPRNWTVERSRRYTGTDVVPYIGQSIEKLRAWEYTSADRVVIVDSDCVFARPVDLATDPDAGVARPVLLWRPWEEAGDANCWHDTTATLLGFEPPYETMCRHPFCFPTWMLHQLWEHMGGEEVLRASERVSDFNLMGNFALAKHPEKFRAIRWDGPVDNHAPDGKELGPDVPRAWVHQFWSHHRAAHPDVRVELEKLGML